MDINNIKSEYFEMMQKHKNFIMDTLTFPNQNESMMLKLIDEDKLEYICDINRKRAILKRCTYQERVHTNIVLLRLDIDTKPHRNPNSNHILSGNHIHIHTDKYGDAYAVELDDPILNIINPDFELDKFIINNEKEDSLIEFFSAFSEFCNMKNIPSIQKNFIDTF